MNAYEIAALLPSVEALRDRCRAAAVLELIVDGGHPYRTYTRGWGPDEAALMDNGSGDEWAVVFGAAGVFIRVFDHESPLSPYGDGDGASLEGLPESFRPYVEEPAFADENGDFLATAVLWRAPGDDRWHVGDGHEHARDGSELLEILVDDVVERLAEWFADYYEKDVDRAIVAHVVAGWPLTDDVVRAFNPEADVDAVRAGLDEIGYP